MSAKLFWHRANSMLHDNGRYVLQIYWKLLMADMFCRYIENCWNTQSAAPSWRHEDGKARCDNAQCRHWGLWESHWMARSTGPSGWIARSPPWYPHLQHLDERLDFGRELEAERKAWRLSGLLLTWDVVGKDLSRDWPPKCIAVAPPPHEKDSGTSDIPGREF